ncbi:translation initiation factor SUI1 [Flagelloscypha sp. PMI_526]|nr:translation initiation factor SUI1 [Flagelloscypha sp. PMI_526]KAH8824783.1 translation initiation factor SUI1 [Flagelloscypha sp. PMI_526]
MGKKSKKGGDVQPATETTPQSEPATEGPPAVPPVQVLYCKVCTFPVEYCEFGSSLTRCKEWLHEADIEVYNKYYSEEALQTKIGTLSLEAQTKLEKDTAKKEAKAEAKAKAALEQKMASQVIIKRVSRTKNKHVTAILGLEAFGIDLKKAAKQFASKFATGSSVSKTATGQEEIVIQGDVSGEVLEMIEEEVGLLKGIPVDNVEIVEEKKKKAG